MEHITEVQMKMYLNETYPRFDYHCDEHFLLFHPGSIVLDGNTISAIFEIKDLKAYSPFPPLELHHALLISNMLILTFGCHTGNFISALIGSLSCRCKSPVFVDEPINAIVSISDVKHKNWITAHTKFNNGAFQLKTVAQVFRKPGELENCVNEMRVSPKSKKNMKV